MAGIQFINTNPAIDQFNAQVQRGDQARRLEEEDFMRRFQMERGIGLDRGIRDVFGRAAAQPATTVAPPVASPVAAPAPAITSYTAQPQVAPMPAPNPADAGIGFGGDVPRLSEAEMAARMGQPTVTPAPVSQPAAAPAPLPRTAPRGGGAGSYRDVMAGLANVPGAGSTMMNLYSAERKDRSAASLEERKMHLEGLRAFREASNHGDLVGMGAINKEYQLGIPEQALRDRQTAVTLATGINLAGKLDDERAAHFMMAYTEAVKSGADQVTAMAAGSKAAQGVKKEGGDFKVAGHITDPQNRITFYDKQGNFKKTDQQTRPPQPPFALSATAGDQREQALMNTAFDNAVRGAGRMWSVMSEQEQNDRVQREVARLRSKGGAAAPAAASAPAPAAKRLRFDNQGNQVQ